MSARRSLQSGARKAERRRLVGLRREGWDAGHLRPLDLRKGDTVLVIAGKDSGAAAAGQERGEGGVLIGAAQRRPRRQVVFLRQILLKGGQR